MDRPEILRRLYEAFGRDDIDTALPHIHPDVEWHSSGLFPGLEPVYRGRDEVREWWVAMREPFESFTIELLGVEERADTIITSVRFHAVGRESGVEVNLPFAHVFRFDGDQIVWYTSYGSLEEARAAA